MKQKKSKPVHYKIFSFYAILIASCYFLLTFFIIINFYNSSLEDAYTSLKNDALVYSQNIDNEILMMDNVAMSALFSLSIDNFLETTDTFMVVDIASELATFVSLSYSVHQAIIHTSDDMFVSSRSNYLRNSQLKNMSWYDDVLKNDGEKYITEPYYSSDDTMSTDETTTQSLISLSRVMKNEYGIVNGIIEVRQYASKIFFELLYAESEDSFQTNIVIDEKQHIVFPYTENTSIDISSLREPLEALPYNSPTIFNNDRELYALYKSKDTGYTVILSVLQHEALSAITISIVMYSFLSVLGIFGIIVFSYYRSRRITKPLSDLKEKIEQYSVLENNVPVTIEKNNTLHSGITEIDELSNTFDEMSKRHEKSILELMQEQQQKLQYKLLALQSQMNPHFLYNSLANISALAEIKEHDKIVYVCKNLSDMLRYISSSKDKNITVYDEIIFSKEYINIQEIRFENMLEFHFDVDTEIYTYMLPKISIQTLIENSCKSCNQTTEKGIISIVGKKKGKGFIIEVTDNGIGFSDESHKTLFDRIEEINNTNIIPKISLNGMGLVNVYLRLKILYENDMIFTIKNVQTGGCTITIGSKKHIVKQEGVS